MADIADCDGEPVAGRIKRALLRFPSAMTAAVAATILELFISYSGRNDIWAAPWLAALAAVFFWSASLRVILENRRVSSLTRQGAPWLAFVALVPALVEGRSSTVHLLILAAAGACALMAAPEVIERDRRPRRALSWLRGLSMAAAFAIGAAGILCTGLSLLVSSLDALFSLRSVDKFFPTLWTVGFGLIAPWCGLALLPRPDAGDGAYPRFVPALLDWVLSPLALAYGLLLNAYCLFILAEWSLPKGFVAIMVASFALVGGAIWTLAFASAEQSGRSSRLLRRVFLPGLAAPAAAMVAATRMRIDQYGLTEARYILLASAALILALVVTAAVRRRTPRPSFAAALAAVAGIAISFGPWGATGLSVENQARRLETALAHAGRFEDGRIRSSTAPVSITDTTTICSTVRFLIGRGEQGRVAALFAMPQQVVFSADPDVAARTVVEAMGLHYDRYVAASGGARSFYWSAERDALDVRGYDYLIGGRESGIVELGDGVHKLDMRLDRKILRLELSIEGGASAGFDLEPFIEEASRSTAKDPFVLQTITTDGTIFRVDLVTLGGTRSQDQSPFLGQIVYRVLLKLPGKPAGG